MGKFQSSSKGIQDKPKAGQNSILMKYMGLGAQFFASILIMLVLGWKADTWIGFATPLLIWILPLLAIVGLLIKVVVETNKKNEEN